MLLGCSQAAQVYVGAETAARTRQLLQANIEDQGISALPTRVGAGSLSDLECSPLRLTGIISDGQRAGQRRRAGRGQRAGQRRRTPGFIAARGHDAGGGASAGAAGAADGGAAGGNGGGAWNKPCRAGTVLAAIHPGIPAAHTSEVGRT